MCISLDKEQSPTGVFFFDNQEQDTDFLQFSESEGKLDESDSRIFFCDDEEEYSDTDSDKCEANESGNDSEEMETLEKIGTKDSKIIKKLDHEIRPPGQITPRSYTVDPKVVVVDVKILFCQNATQKVMFDVCSAKSQLWYKKL